MGSLAKFRASILTAAILFSTGGAAIKACGFGGLQVAGFRSAIAAALFALVLPASRRRWNWKTLVVGMIYAGTMISFVLSNKLTTAANTIFLQSAAPIYVLLLSPWVLRERITRRDFLWILLVGIGLGLFFVEVDAPIQSAPDPLKGNLIALVAGLFWGLTLMGLRWLERDSDPESPSGLTGVLAGNLIAAAICIPLALPVEDSRLLDWVVIAYLGLFQIGVAYIFLTIGFRRVPAFEGSLLILLEPTLSPVWAWLFQNEVPGAWSLLGGTLILLTCTLQSFLSPSSQPPSETEPKPS
ncbi:MAG: EamA family transporter [Planctomycetota bacterium]|jgi:drug/metabolite transporter (DMT)-like permease|nr:EamA family transporter [Planctomycetota bacterium]